MHKMNADARQPALRPDRCAASGCERAARDPALVALLEASRDYFALSAEAIQAPRAGTAAARGR
jgi:hypothetical protein